MKVALPAPRLADARPPSAPVTRRRKHAHPIRVAPQNGRECQGRSHMVDARLTKESDSERRCSGVAGPPAGESRCGPALTHRELGIRGLDPYSPSWSTEAGSGILGPRHKGAPKGPVGHLALDDRALVCRPQYDRRAGDRVAPIVASPTRCLLSTIAAPTSGSSATTTKVALPQPKGCPLVLVALRCGGVCPDVTNRHHVVFRPWQGEELVWSQRIAHQSAPTFRMGSGAL